jgi:carbon monoxide dehydrogenase subunit G
VHVEETFFVARPSEVVFDYVTNPTNLSSWQTSNRSVEQLSDGPPGLRSRFRERTKPPLGKEFEQVTEFTEFDRPRRVHVHIVEGPFPVHGTWIFEPAGDGTLVRFIAEGELGGLIKPFEPVVRRLLARQLSSYHRNLKQNIERG